MVKASDDDCLVIGAIWNRFKSHSSMFVIASSSSGRQLVHGNTQVPQLLVLGIVGYLFSQESYCFVSAQVF